MPFRLFSLCASGALALTLTASSQAPAAAPSGAHGMCNDGTYSMAASKSGACRGHQGVKTWFTASTAAPPSPAPAAASPAPTTASLRPVPSPASASPAPVPAPAPVSRPAPASAAAPRAQAAGGGNGQVWVNTSTKVYHCQGDRSYGTTKAGQYMSEADAAAKGARPAYGKTCSK